jgi:hypothetical protein
MSIVVSAREFSASAESRFRPAADEADDDALGFFTAARAEMGVPFSSREERWADDAGDDANDGGLGADRWVDEVGDAGRRDADGVVLPAGVETGGFLGVVEAMGDKEHSIPSR